MISTSNKNSSVHFGATNITLTITDCINEILSSSIRKQNKNFEGIEMQYLYEKSRLERKKLKRWSMTVINNKE